MTAVEPRPAATVMLLRDQIEADTGNVSLQVFMQLRHKTMAFGGAHVFPGGAVDPQDNVAAVPTPHLSDDVASARLGLDAGGRAYYLAALRECFEEVGVLLASSPPMGDTATLATLRRRLDDGDLTLMDLVTAVQTELEPERLHYVGHFITPATEPTRFDTRFFIAALPAGQEPRGEHAEIVDAEWIAPSDALDRNRSGDIFLVGPTEHSLEFLTAFDSSAQALAYVAEKQDTPVPVENVPWGQYLPQPTAVACAHGGAS